MECRHSKEEMQTAQGTGACPICLGEQAVRSKADYEAFRCALTHLKGCTPKGPNVEGCELCRMALVVDEGLAPGLQILAALDAGLRMLREAQKVVRIVQVQSKHMRPFPKMQDAMQGFLRAVSVFSVQPEEPPDTNGGSILGVGVKS